MPEVVAGSLAAGATSIASYHLEWNAGSGTTFTELLPATEERTRTQGSLTEGQSYTFRYWVKNIHGLSLAPSPQVIVMAAKKPSAPAVATTALTGLSVTISWQPPAANGKAIRSYSVEIQDNDGAWHLETGFCDVTDPAAACTAQLCTCTLP